MHGPLAAPKCVLALAVLLLFAGLSPASAKAPDTSSWDAFERPYFDYVTVRDGLPHSTVTAIVQDRAGPVWMGTFGGLVRYDGYRMQVYRHVDDRADSLPDSYVRVLRPLPDGDLLVGTNAGGVARFDAASNRFRRYPVDSRDADADKIFDLAADGRGGFWVASGGGLRHLDPDSGRWRDAGGAALPADMARRTFSVLQDRSGNLWAGTNSGLFERAAGSDAFVRVRADDAAADAILHDKIWALYQDRGGRIWVGTGQSGSLYLDADGQAHRVTGLSGEHGVGGRRTVRAFLESRRGVLWIATDGDGVVTCDLRSGRVRHLVHDPSRASSLNGNITRALLQDRAGNIWVATELGAARYDPDARTAFSLLPSLADSDALSDADVHAVFAAPDGRVWLGLGLGHVDVLDPADGHVRHLQLDGAQAQRDVQAFAIAPDGSLWAGSQGVARIDPKTFAVRPSMVPALDDGLVLSMLVDGGDLWIGTYDGAYRYRFADASLQRFHHDPADPHSLVGDQVRDIHRMPDGALWFSTVSGISVLRPGATGFETIRHDAADPHSLPHDYTGSITRPVAGHRWIGTFGGLARLDGGPPYRFTTVSIGAGLASPAINAAVADGHGRIWASTAEGVSVVDAATLEVRNLGVRDGLRIDSYIHRSAARTADGSILFGGLGGLTVIRPGATDTAPPLPHPALTQLTLGERTLPFADLAPEGGTLHIDDGTGDLHADFALLDFRAPLETHYRFRLRGFDREWRRVPYGSPPGATYTNLPAGRYVFEVQARTLGLHARRVASDWTLVVAPRWYETAGFRIAVATLLLALALLAGWLYTRHLRQRARRLARAVAVRTRALREANQQLEHLATTDALTGLLNRRSFLERADRALREAGNARQPLSLAVIDLDHFKRINDSLGHPVGDGALRAVAALLGEACRDRDLLARYGGEELMLLLPGLDEVDALAVAERMRRTLAAVPLHVGEHALSVTTSIGIAQWRAPAETLAELIARADRALYAAKAAGRDRCMAASTLFARDARRDD